VINKAFDRIWHKGFLYKLKSIGIAAVSYSLSTTKYNEVSSANNLILQEILLTISLM
jgi:hypothetical protein